MTTRRLSDLMQVGKEVVFGDEEGTITVFLRKLTPIDLQAAIKHANAARSRARTRFLDEDGDDFQSALSASQAMGVETAINFLLSCEAGEIAEKHESKVADEPEWKDDSYLEGLRDAWVDLETTYFTLEEDDPERAEASRVFEELKKFSTQVEKGLDAEIEDMRDVYEQRKDDWLFYESAKKSAEGDVEQAWLAAYREAEILYGVRQEKDHNKRYFESFDEVRNLASPMVTRILEEYHALNVNPTEGKGSAEAPTS